MTDTGRYGLGLRFCVFAFASACATSPSRPPDYSSPGSPIAIRPHIGAAADTTRPGGLADPSFGRLALRNGKNCGGCQVWVWIGAFANEHHINVNNPPPYPGQPIALVINTGNVATDMYDLEPWTTTIYDLYVYSDNGTPAWELRPRNSAGDRSRHGKPTQCQPAHPPKDVDDADFSDCNHRDYGVSRTFRGFAAQDPSPLLVATAMSSMTASNLSEAGIWFSCSGGCCTA